jgi:hypothetical protein
MEVIEASPDFVMAWWFHQDRTEEVRQFMESSVGAEVSLTKVTTDEARTSTFRYRDAKGWDHIQYVEIRLTGVMLPELHGDRYVVPVIDLMTFEHPESKQRSVACSGRIEVRPVVGGHTEVTVVHDHTITGFRVLRRRPFLESTREKTEAAFKATIDRCRIAAGDSPSDLPSP